MADDDFRLGGIQTFGFGELYRALHEVEPDLASALKAGLTKVGELVREDASERLIDYNHRARQAADGFRTRVRSTGRVDVEQSRRKTSGSHPEYGSVMMRHGLLPAREARLPEASQILDVEVTKKLRARGF